MATTVITLEVEATALTGRASRIVVVGSSAAGPVGPQGATGATGAAGATGAKGDKGDPGNAATIAVGTVTTGAPGSSATVINAGTSSAAVFDFAIPRGDVGATGAAGSAATIVVGNVTTGAPGSSATVSNSGSSSAAVFDFSIPQGAKGDKGDAGDTGATGATGAAGAAGQWDTAQTTDTKSDSYTLLTADAGKLILMNKSTAQDVTVNGSLDLSVGQRIDVIQTGAGQVTFVASSATVNATPGLKLRARYSAATVVCVGTDSYVVVGDLSA
jgi:hypothetical protein